MKPKKATLRYFFIFLYYMCHRVGITSSYKICSKSYNSAACEQLTRKTPEISCEYNEHNVDCLLNIQNGVSDFGGISGEEAFLGANLVQNVVVLGKIIREYNPSETVIIMKNKIPSTVTDLRGLKFCHPGFKNDKMLPHLMLQELERDIIKRANTSFCSGNATTVIEEYIKTIGNFFGNSCRPGLWVQDIKLDEELKRKYSSLCELCGENRCNVEYLNPFYDVLNTCLIGKGADIALTSISEAKLFFARSVENRRNYKYFCKNETSLAPPSSCIWSSQVPDIIITSPSAIGPVTQYLERNLNSNESAGALTKEYLRRILNLRNKDRIEFTNYTNYKSLKEYVREFRTIPTIEFNSECERRKLNWCCYTDMEKNKCLWLSQASLNKGLLTEVNCVSSEYPDELSCLNTIQKGVADIMTLSTNLTYVAIKKNVVSLAYPENISGNASRIVFVKKIDDDSISTLDDLKGKRACLPEYGGKEFLILIDALKKHNILQTPFCDFFEDLGAFLENSCIPGAHSPEREVGLNLDIQNKFCKNCVPNREAGMSSYCNADTKNRYYSSMGSIRCLEDGSADFAVVTTEELDFDLDGSNFTTICNSYDTSSPTLQYCDLTEIIMDEIVIKRNNEKIEDIKITLREFERWFGEDLQKSFHLFSVFNKTKNLLFKSGTVGLGFSEDGQYIKNFMDLKRRSEICTPHNGVGRNVSLVHSFLIFFNILYLLYSLIN